MDVCGEREFEIADEGFSKIVYALSGSCRIKIMNKSKVVPKRFNVEHNGKIMSVIAEYRGDGSLDLWGGSFFWEWALIRDGEGRIEGIVIDRCDIHDTETVISEVKKILGVDCE